jgi:arylsulfatase A-like enzyme
VPLDAPNVLLVVLDTLRRDAVEPYGAPAGASPAIADLARAGSALADVRATSSWTLPSHASMFTGAMPRELGLGQAPNETPTSARPVMRAQRDRMLPEVLKRAGYATGGVSTNMWAGSPSGFDTGFAQFADVDSSRHAQIDGGLRRRARWGWEALAQRGIDDGAAQAEEVLADWTEQAPPQPFFWFVNLVECHSPYLPPAPYDGVSRAGRLRAADDARRYLTFKAIARACCGAAEVPERALELMRDLYAGSVRYVDDWVARLLARLDRVGVLDDTLVIVTSDHGENFGENGLIAHGMSLDDRLLGVPFVAAGPRRGELEGMRSLAELPARIAAVAGLDDHPWADGGLPAGAALAQWDPMLTASDPRAEALRSDWDLDDDALHRLTSVQTCAADGRWKLLRNGGAEQLFDVEADPLEAAPVAPGPETAAVADRLRAALDHEAATARPEALVPDTGDAPSADELAHIEQRMKLMGYM